MVPRVEREASPKHDGKGKEIRQINKVIMVVIIVVMLGYLMMWFVMPTNLYKKHWRTTMSEKLSSTFGNKGTSIFIYTIPVLLIAVLGSVYLYLGKKYVDYDHGIPRKEENATTRKLLATWRRPVLVRGPLGIVSGVELSFLIMFIALLVWSLTVYLYLGYAKIKIHGDKRWLSKWKTTVLQLGLTGNICLSMLFYPVTRGSSILTLLGLTSEGSIKYHIWLGHLTMSLFTAHGLGYILCWAVSGQLSKALKWKKTGVSNLAGELSLIFGLILWATTFPRIRRKFFEIFFYTHNLYILFIIFFLFHVSFGYGFYMLPGFYLFIIDRYLRFLQSRHRVRLVSGRILDCGVIELNFAKSMRLRYNPTSIMFVNVPSVSKLQWHPFSVSSSGNLEEDVISVVIRVEGSWTRKVYEIIEGSSSSGGHVRVSVEGPYGPAFNHFRRYDTLVMVSGGSGITPFFSIIRDLLFTSTQSNSQTPKVLLISSFQKSSDISILNFLLPLSGTSDLSTLDLQIKAYITRENTRTQDHITHPQTVWFTPIASDSPISPTLGKNSWLWLAAIIGSSFIGFLIFMGILTRYYIYPAEHNTNRIFPSAISTVYYLLILCSSIGLAASGAFLWNKKRNSMEINQIINAPNADRELESFPQKSVLEFTEVHYGERPDLKKLLLDCNGSSIGVLASGPRGLRQEVAGICRSGLVENLHFESISFSW